MASEGSWAAADSRIGWALGAPRLKERQLVVVDVRKTEGELKEKDSEGRKRGWRQDPGRRAILVEEAVVVLGAGALGLAAALSGGVAFMYLQRWDYYYSCCIYTALPLRGSRDDDPNRMAEYFKTFLSCIHSSNCSELDIWDTMYPPLGAHANVSRPTPGIENSGPCQSYRHWAYRIQAPPSLGHHWACHWCRGPSVENPRALAVALWASSRASWNA